MREQVLEILDDLYDEVQNMRENGDGDLRSVLSRIDLAIVRVREIDNQPKIWINEGEL